MPPLTRAGFSQLMQPDLYRVYIETGEQAPIEFQNIFNIIDMPYNPVTDQQVSGLGTVPMKAEGAQFDFDQPIVGGAVDYLAQSWGLGIEFTWESWRDELYGVFQEMTKELRRASDNRMEVNAHAILNLAKSSSAVGFDNVSLLNSAHPLLGGGNIGNTPTIPIQFSYTAVQAAAQHFHNMKDERSQPRLMAPSMALITPAYYHDAREILGSTNKPLTSGNELNALIQDDLSWMVSHYLLNQEDWFILARQGVHDMNYFIRDAPSFEMFDDERTRNAVAVVYQRDAVGFGTWRGVYGG